VAALEADLAELKILYERYFRGLERHPPAKRTVRFRRALIRLLATIHPNTCVRYRLWGVRQSFVAYDRLWRKTQRLVDEGAMERTPTGASPRRRAPRAAAAVKPAPPRVRTGGAASAR
jgi:hypothetical protein